MNTIYSFIKRHPFVTFVLITYILSWSIIIPTHGLLLPWGPMLSALAVVSITQGRAGLKAYWQRVTRLGAGLRWYGLAVAIPVVVTLTAAAMNLLFGAHLPANVDWMAFLKTIPLLLVVSGMWEEPGWTGFALPGLLERFATAPYGTLLATMILAVVRTIWHLPLMIYGHIYWSDIIGVIAVQFVITWLFKSSKNNVRVVMLMHLMNNIVVGQLLAQLFSGADWVRFYWFIAILWSALAIAVLFLAGSNLVRRASSAPVKAPQTGEFPA